MGPHGMSRPRSTSTPLDRTRSARQGPARAAKPLSKYELYELTVQNPAALVPLLLAIHGGSPRVLAEDFSGTAALSRAWLKAVPRSKAVAADIDPEPLRRAGRNQRLKTIVADVLRSPLLAQHRADVLFVGNFSIGEIHARRDLVRYLRRAKARLNPGGVFVCDTYGGESAFRTGSIQRMHPGPKRDPALRIRYTWQQRAADPITGRVENALHFRTDRGGDIEQELTDAFVYRWRLWSLPELRDAMLEAGFQAAQIHQQIPDAVDAEGKAYARPITDPAELDDSYIVCVAGRC